MNTVKQPDAGDQPEPRLGRVLDFLRVLWAVDHGLQRVSKRMHAEHGFTGLQRMMLRIVGRFGGLSAGELASILHVHPSTLTGALDKLVRAGAVLRQTDPDDGRRALLFLGARGRSIDAIRSGTVEAAVKRAFARLSPKDIDTAARVMKAIAEELEDQK